jgi:hypothetical protein
MCSGVSPYCAKGRQGQQRQTLRNQLTCCARLVCRLRGRAMLQQQPQRVRLAAAAGLVHGGLARLPPGRGHRPRTRQPQRCASSRVRTHTRATAADATRQRRRTRLVRASRRAPCWSRTRMTSQCPWFAALCSGVLPSCGEDDDGARRASARGGGRKRAAPKKATALGGLAAGGLACLVARVHGHERLQQRLHRPDVALIRRAQKLDPAAPAWQRRPRHAGRRRARRRRYGAELRWGGLASGAREEASSAGRGRMMPF